MPWTRGPRTYCWKALKWRERAIPMATQTPILTRTSRIRIQVGGLVQGVGFRPFVYRLACELQLTGWVENSPRGVTIEVEGPRGRLAEFRRRLQSDAPCSAAILACDSTMLDPGGFTAFEIRTSSSDGKRTALILPDLAVCDDCLADVLDPANRRFGYPFTNCTNCGPRFSIIEALPYDRANTSMKAFSMCDDCREEYENPADRRFHAQPNACPDCGPHVELWNSDGKVTASREVAMLAAAAAIRSGKIVALKGLGGFQLLADARNEAAIDELRRRKNREEKPFALLLPTLYDARELCDMDEIERRLLTSTAAPIVLIRRRIGGAKSVAESVAPGLPELGVLLPYTPLHHILMRELSFAIVATSGNRSDEPICIDEREALERLRGIADLFLVHDRPIVRPMDDSVTRVVAGREMILRRARGFAPLPISMKNGVSTVLALGGHQKNTVALAVGDRVFLSQHVGDLVNREGFDCFTSAATDLPRLYDAKRDLVACDLHPDYPSTLHAEGMGCPVARVQHHHAHVASCMVENELEGSALGVSWDGTGLGTDGAVWGGEFLLCDGSYFERIAALRTFSLPGGDTASREPRRSALGVLHDLFGDAAWDQSDVPTIRAFTAAERKVLSRTLRKRIQCPLTSSMGRLFDAVASLIGVRQRVRNEARAAMELEALAFQDVSSDSYPFDVCELADARGTAESAQRIARWVVDWRPMVFAILDDARAGVETGRIARTFHKTLADMIVRVAKLVGETSVVLSGGCFQNRVLSETAIAGLRENGFRPYWHRLVPPNDGGLSLGQAEIARRRIMEASPCA